MKLDLMTMSSIELEVLEQNLQIELDIKLRNMMYDDHMDELFNDLEQIRVEKNRRQTKNG